MKLKNKKPTNKKGTVVRCYEVSAPKIKSGKVMLKEFISFAADGCEYWKARYKSFYIDGQMKSVSAVNDFRPVKVKGLDSEGKPYSFKVKQKYTPVDSIVLVRRIS